MLIKLNLGSGKSKKKGYVNIDKIDDCDIRLDLERERLPQQDSTVEEIEAENFFVMIKNIRFVLNECHRVLITGGKLNMLNFDAGKYPSLYFQDPEHNHGFTRETYNYFCEDTEAYRNFGKEYGYKPWNITKIKEEGKCLRVSLQKVES